MAKLPAAITPVVSAISSFRKHFYMQIWCLLLSSMLNTVVLLNIFVETMTQAAFISNNIRAFNVTFNQFNMS